MIILKNVYIIYYYTIKDNSYINNCLYKILTQETKILYYSIDCKYFKEREIYYIIILNVKYTFFKRK